QQRPVIRHGIDHHVARSTGAVLAHVLVPFAVAVDVGVALAGIARAVVVGVGERLGLPDIGEALVGQAGDLDLGHVDHADGVFADDVAHHLLAALPGDGVAGDAVARRL